VIDIIRYDEDPKKALMAEDWSIDHHRASNESDYVSPTNLEGELTAGQVEAILNMRLRSLRRLEEMVLRRERDDLMQERVELEDLLADQGQQWNSVAEQIKETKKKFGKDYLGGKRKSKIEDYVDIEDVPIEALIEKEPITVVCSKMGWVRAMTGHIDLEKELKFKDGDGPNIIFHAETTDRLLVFGSNGRFYTILASNLPGGRGTGEPLRLMVDLPNDSAIINIHKFNQESKLIVASTAGDGFVVPMDEVLAQTRNGKQVLNVKGTVKAAASKIVEGNYVATVGENRKVLIFDLEELPIMQRGKGVRLQKYKDGGLSDVTTFSYEDGLSWLDPAGRTRTETELGEWKSRRASAGKMAPRGFPRENKF
jgi:topoisomerase-4 subunit A